MGRKVFKSLPFRPALKIVLFPVHRQGELLSDNWVFLETALRHTLALINCQCYCLAGNKRRQGDRMLSAICEHCKSGSWRTLCALSPRIPPAPLRFSLYPPSLSIF